MALSSKPTSFQYRRWASLPFFLQSGTSRFRVATGRASGCDWYRKRPLASHDHSWLNLWTTIEK
jgi:hypothetical protein